MPYLLQMHKELQQTLISIAAPLYENNISWGVGASLLLYQYGLVDSPADIDIITEAKDIEKANDILFTLGTRKPKEEEKGIYSTDFFSEYSINSTDIDIMAGFKINLSTSVYEYTFDKDSVPHHFLIEDIFVPFMTLEDWYILYQLIPNRESKVKLIENYFMQNGIEYPHLLQRSLNNPTLPQEVILRSQKLFSTQK